MKRTGFYAGLSLMVGLLFLNACQQPAVPPTNRGDLSTNSAGETMDRSAIEAELLRIENDWPRVIREKDVAAVRKVEADDGVFIYPDGSIGNKEKDIKDMESGALSADSFEVRDLKVNVLDADSAVVSGHYIVKNGKYKLPDGKSMDISGEYRFVDTFHRRAGEWKLVAGAGVPIQQPASGASPAKASSPAAASSPATKTAPTKAVSPASKAAPATTATPKGD